MTDLLPDQRYYLQVFDLHYNKYKVCIEIPGFGPFIFHIHQPVDFRYVIVHHPSEITPEHTVRASHHIHRSNHLPMRANVFRHAQSRSTTRWWFDWHKDLISSVPLACCCPKAIYEQDYLDQKCCKRLLSLRSTPACNISTWLTRFRHYCGSTRKSQHWPGFPWQRFATKAKSSAVVLVTRVARLLLRQPLRAFRAVADLCQVRLRLKSHSGLRKCRVQLPRCRSSLSLNRHVGIYAYFYPCRVLGIQPETEAERTISLSLIVILYFIFNRLFNLNCCSFNFSIKVL